MAKTRLTAEQAKQALERCEREPEKSWSILKSLVFDLYARLDVLEKATIELAKQDKRFRPILEMIAKQIEAKSGEADEANAEVAVEGAPAEAPVETAPPAADDGVRMGADGTPITDPTQLEAERAMDEAMGVAPPAPQRGNGNGNGNGNGRRRKNGNGGPRKGADGSVITDPAQLAAEQAMDEAMGVSE